MLVVEIGRCDRLATVGWIDCWPHRRSLIWRTFGADEIRQDPPVFQARQDSHCSTAWFCPETALSQVQAASQAQA
ncbi:hypothetical protein, partial [Mesorhizobium sp. M7A.F.Ca.US.014.04.1.1]|uniref:hypothetical protein n=1 Tax=Mesorhizobium sp. M7A.F.Ca.US.014.04.1.1 TaxID=2496744 RepID=UPI0019CFE195